jgi:hypothetical protein
MSFCCIDNYYESIYKNFVKSRENNCKFCNDLETIKDDDDEKYENDDSKSENKTEVNSDFPDK